VQEESEKIMSPQTENQDPKTALQNALNALIAGLSDAATLTVETRTFKLGDPEAERPEFRGKLAVRTIIEVDGDTFAGVPVTDEAAGEINEKLLDLHNKNVERALQYRVQLLQSGQQLIKDLIEMIKTS
jgi:hypothetical protein